MYCNVVHYLIQLKNVPSQARLLIKVLYCTQWDFEQWHFFQQMVLMHRYTLFCFPYNYTHFSLKWLLNFQFFLESQKSNIAISQIAWLPIFVTGRGTTQFWNNSLDWNILCYGRLHSLRLQTCRGAGEEAPTNTLCYAQFPEEVMLFEPYLCP